MANVQAQVAPYPVPPGDKRFFCIDILGPSSYSQISTGSPPTSGQTVKASDCGITQFDFVQSMGSDNGAYDGVCFPGVVANGLAMSQIQLMWITASTGAQVSGATNLSARTMRLWGFGY